MAALHPSTVSILIGELKKYNKVYGTYTPRKINGEPAEYSFIIENDGKYVHFFTDDFRNNLNFIRTYVRSTRGPKDFTGRTNHSVPDKELFESWDEYLEQFNRQLDRLFAE